MELLIEVFTEFFIVFYNFFRCVIMKKCFSMFTVEN